MVRKGEPWEKDCRPRSGHLQMGRSGRGEKRRRRRMRMREGGCEEGWNDGEMVRWAGKEGIRYRYGGSYLVLV